MHRNTLAECLYGLIETAGVDKIFGVPGDFSLGMLDTLESLESIQWVGCATELGAAYCADGYARVNGLGVVMTTYGVGELSAATALAGSTAEDVGVLHVVAAPPQVAFDEGKSLHHTFADGDLYRFKRVARELHTKVFHAIGEDAVTIVEKAISYWRSSRKTTYLLIPQDVANKEVAYSNAAVTVKGNSIARSAEAMIDAFEKQYPQAAILLGNVAQRRGLRNLASELSKSGRPMAVFPNAKGLVDEKVLNYLGVYNGKLSKPGVKELVEGACGRVLIGCVIADTTTGGLSHDFPAESTLIIGSDSVRWGDSEVECPINSSTGYYAQLICGDRPGEEIMHHDETVSANTFDESKMIDQKSMWQLLSEFMPGNCRLFAETGSAHYGALDNLFPENTVYESAAIWSAIGFALPAALGASLADNSRRVIAVIGDGAAQMTASEFGLVDRYGANPIIVILDNAGYTVERVIRGEFARYNDVSNWLWGEIPRVLGANTASTTICETQGKFVSALKMAYADKNNAHVLVVPLGRYDATDSLLKMGDLLRKKAGLPSLNEAIEKGV